MSKLCSRLWFICYRAGSCWPTIHVLEPLEQLCLLSLLLFCLSARCICLRFNFTFIETIHVPYISRHWPLYHTLCPEHVCAQLVAKLLCTHWICFPFLWINYLCLIYKRVTTCTTIYNRCFLLKSERTLMLWVCLSCLLLWVTVVCRWVTRWCQHLSINIFRINREANLFLSQASLNLSLDRFFKLLAHSIQSLSFLDLLRRVNPIVIRVELKLCRHRGLHQFWRYPR